MPKKKTMSDDYILSVARDLFIEKGSTLSAQVIADSVGISQPSLFKRFGTKEDIIIKAMAPEEKLPVIDVINEMPYKDISIEKQIRDLLFQIDHMLNIVLPKIEVLKESRIPKEKVWRRYKTPPPILIIETMTNFFDRIKKNGLTNSNFQSDFISRLILGSLIGQRSLESHRIEDVDSNFIESLHKFVCLNIFEGEIL